MASRTPHRPHAPALAGHASARRSPPGPPRETEPGFETLGRMLSGVAHEFNNVLTAIQIYAGLLAERLPVEHSARPCADQIRAASEQGALLVGQLTAFSSLPAAQPRLADLDGVIAGMAEMLARLLGESIELHHQRASQPAWVRVPPAQMRQVLLNLALNARDAMPAGGRLTLATSHHEISAESAARYPGLQAGPCVRLTVTDTGCGLDALARQHIFEPYFTTKLPGRGSGLGLANVYGIVQQNQGSIWLESEPGQGTTVFLLLPAASAAELLLADAEEEEAPPACGSETVLVVEDAEVVRAAVVDALRAYGYRVLEAAEGAEALRLAAQHPGGIDLVLTDLVLPGMTGREVAWRLDASHAGTPVLYITGYLDAVARRQLARSLVFPKPFDAARLARRVRQVLQAARRRLPASA